MHDGTIVAPADTSPTTVASLQRAVAPVERAASPSHPRLHCPFPVRAHHRADAIEQASVRWAEAMGLVSGGRAVRKLAAARTGRLAALAFPDLPDDALHIAADWTTAFCLLDDHTERDEQACETGPDDEPRTSSASTGAAALRLATELDRVLAALVAGVDSSDRPLRRAFADLGRRLAHAPARWRQRFHAEVERLFAFFVLESVQRASGLRPDRTTYRRMREVTVGLHPLFLLGELGAAITPPDESEAALLGELTAIASRVVGFANDLFTADKERQEGGFHNRVLLEIDADHDEAMARVAAEHDAEVRDFEQRAATLAHASPSPTARWYVAACERWMGGHLAWARETARYLPHAEAAVQGA